MKRVIVVGGGIAGLSVAWAVRWREPGTHLTVLERGPRTGGNIRTEHVDGYTCEAGPDGFLDNAPATLHLVRQLGLEKRLLPSCDAARKRYIFRCGRLHQVPLSALEMVTSGLLSPLGKARLLCEPFSRRRPEADESIHDFASRHIGAEPPRYWWTRWCPGSSRVTCMRCRCAPAFRECGTSRRNTAVWCAR